MVVQIVTGTRTLHYMYIKIQFKLQKLYLPIKICVSCKDMYTVPVVPRNLNTLT